MFGLNSANFFSVIIAERVSQLFFNIQGANKYTFLATNPLLYWRGKTLLTKEKETIEWLNELTKTDLLYDVGANVGVYSIYAGKNGNQVYAFEPVASNYSILNTNIQVNNISDNVKSFCLAISDSSIFSSINLSSLVPGSAHNCFDDNKNYADQSFAPEFQQGCFSMTLDEIVYNHSLTPPSHLKIDVDGLESKIIAGAPKLLADKCLRSILIELNEDLPRDKEIINTILGHGFAISKTGPAEQGQDSMNVRNFIFKRA